MAKVSVEFIFKFVNVKIKQRCIVLYGYQTVDIIVYSLHFSEVKNAVVGSEYRAICSISYKYMLSIVSSAIFKNFM